MEAVLDLGARIVSVVVTGVPRGVTVAGLKVQVTAVVLPQLKLTGPLNPPTGVIVSVTVENCPAARERELALAEMLKSGPTMVSSMPLELLGAKVELPP
jgi:hypothetical protein